MVGDDSALVAEVHVSRVESEVADLVFRAREAAGLTQAQLAAKIGTTQSVVSRLEDADYRGHSLPMLKRIADALGMRLEIRFGSARGGK
jgi:ribosome-binding protein aMBF1 (putative translation factor)